MTAVALIIEDDQSLATVLGMTLKDSGFSVESVTDGLAGAARLKAGGIALALLDLNLPGRHGLEILRDLAADPARDDRPAVIVMTANGSIASAVEAMRLGAADYLVKPFSMDELTLRADRVRRTGQLLAENRELRARLGAATPRDRLVGSSPSFRAALDTLTQAAASEATILITGESGTGKELAARLVHAVSPRAEGPFIAVNCAAIPEALIESELFGHVKGAFTGAGADHAGRFERAQGGTLFFDEIGDLHPALQAKLLRAIQEREIERVGGTRPIPVDVRLVAATNMDLRDAVAAKRFREDLYYRLHVVTVTLPPLRERRDDLPALAAYLLHKLGRPDATLAPETLARLHAHRWPGNVRELEHALERAVVLLGRDARVITPDLLPAEVGGSGTGRMPFELPDEGLKLEDVERSLLEQALARTAGNQTRAAALLGLSRPTLIYRMEKFGLK
jgi:two-component system NtrC family response regulator